ncbi:uncharacterized protein LACBIDRAFT_313447 [Laccaria bicolor S238N-H82]|uniref:Predicted protein n=1 Tax=Laccaria bicolor (strain S238N-H82 / ATCC MYA-4686) TaxID=486041 RepID=B0D026_LACBS|nr:uncharacterized protein LACBIDRAFT_313447 [Laccaria bicolor S238N-H82]EDR11754.1 predicted protein [Laccaria bicolor S238N-H82]|eukprot:XP_001877651.1 predicted protein [Laccaria bicolor S238N-H82]
MSLVEDDGKFSPITMSSDVYTFALVCLEVATGRLPYPHRTNNHAVAHSRSQTCQGSSLPCPKERGCHLGYSRSLLGWH